MEITKDIISAKRDKDNDGIFEVVCMFKAQEGELSTSFPQPFAFEPNPSSDDFIAFNDLMPEIILGWVESVLTDEKIKYIEQTLKTQLQTIKDFSPSKEYEDGLPWVA